MSRELGDSFESISTDPDSGGEDFLQPEYRTPSRFTRLPNDYSDEEWPISPDPDSGGVLLPPEYQVDFGAALASGSARSEEDTVPLELDRRGKSPHPYRLVGSSEPVLLGALDHERIAASQAVPQDYDLVSSGTPADLVLSDEVFIERRRKPSFEERRARSQERRYTLFKEAGSPKTYYLHKHGINVNGRLPIEAPRFQDQVNMEQTATQPATQPYFDPRRAGQSGILDPEDEADVLLFLHPTTQTAIDAVQKCADYSPQHIRENEGLPDKLVDQDEDALYSVAGDGGGDKIKSPIQHDLALRLSSRVQDICLGFVFGRDPNICDIIIKPEHHAKLRISSMHFRIYVTDTGVIMIEDTSTNGTFVDDVLLKCKDPNIGTPQRRTLDHGSMILVITYTEEDTKFSERACFVVRYPDRNPEALALYRANLKRYINCRKDARTKAEETVVQINRNPRDVPNATPEQIVANGDGLFGVGTARYNHGMRWNGGDKYSVVDQIGKGAFAVVYKLATRSEGTLFAAKEIEKLRFARKGDIDTKLNNELEIMKQIDHPHIVKFVDYHDSSSHLYIILEFVGGGDLLGYMHRNGRMDEHIAQSMTRQLCHALSYIHSRNIAHRDVKPDNILISNLEPLVVKLSDFGLSKMIEDGDASVLKTFCGTLLYCAPEVYPDYEDMRAHKHVTRFARYGEKKAFPRYGSNVDIWSLAAVIFHVLVMEPPFEGKSENQGASMLKTIMKTRIDFRPFSRVGVSQECINFLRAMLRIHPEERPDAITCLGHDWIRGITDVDQTVQNAIHKPGMLDSRTDADGDSQMEGTPFGLEYGIHSKAFGEAREASRTSSVSERSMLEAPVNTAGLRASRPRLFGEVTSSGLPDSGIFGMGQAPMIAAGVESKVAGKQRALSGGGYLLRSQRSVNLHSDEHGCGLSSTVSQIQELRVDSPGWPDSFASLATSGIKRGRGKEDEEEGEAAPASMASKRFMTSIEAPPTDETILPTGETRVTTILGLLTPVQGSIDVNHLILTDRLTVWGRYPGNTHVFTNPMDTRVPKIGMDIVFWRPGIEESIKQGAKWLEIKGTYALLKTRSSRGLKINGVLLEKDAEGGPFMCGKLKTGDVIEIFDNGHDWLRYECAFYHGLSAKARAAGGDPFVVEENRELWESVSARVAELSTLGK